VTVMMKTLTDEVPLIADVNESVLNFKKLVSEIVGHEPENLKLIFKGIILKNINTLTSYGIDEGSTIIVTITKSQIQAPTPSLSSLQNQNDETKEMMESMLQSPLMQSLLSNEEFLKNILSNNPYTKKLIENNPELKHYFDDPETIRHMADIMKNPALRDEMIRNSDRAMAQIENIPGGFKYLQRMNHQMGDPYEALYQSTQNRNQNNNEQPQNEEYKQTAPTNTPLPNPWASNQNQNNNNRFNMMQNMMGNLVPQNSDNPQINPMFNTMPYFPMMQPNPNPNDNPNLPPEERFESQLKELDEMGFTNKEVNIRALIQTRGNVNSAITLILGVF